MSQRDWDRVVSADKDAPAWLQLSSKRECAVYVSNLPLSVTAEKLEGQLDSEAECNVVEVYLLKVRKTVLSWLLFSFNLYYCQFHTHDNCYFLLFGRLLGREVWSKGKMVSATRLCYKSGLVILIGQFCIVTYKHLLLVSENDLVRLPLS